MQSALRDIEPPSESYSDYLSHYSESEDEEKSPPSVLQPVVEQHVPKNMMLSAPSSRHRYKTVSDDNESEGLRGAAGRFAKPPEANDTDSPFKSNHCDEDSGNEVEVLQPASAKTYKDRAPTSMSSNKSYGSDAAYEPGDSDSDNGSDSESEWETESPNQKLSKPAATTYDPADSDSNNGSDSDSESESETESPNQKLSKPAAIKWSHRVSQSTSLSGLSGLSESDYDSDMDLKPRARKKKKPALNNGGCRLTQTMRPRVSDEIERGRKTGSKSFAKKKFRHGESEVLSVDESDSSEGEQAAPFVGRKLESAAPAGSSSCDEYHSYNQVEESPSSMSQKRPVKSTEGCSGHNEQARRQKIFEYSSSADEWYGDEPERRQSTRDCAIESQRSTCDSEEEEEEEESPLPLRRSSRARAQIDPEDHDLQRADKDDEEEKTPKEKPKAKRVRRSKKKKKEEEVYVVENILNRYNEKCGDYEYNVLYMVSWKGYPEEYDELIPPENMHGEDLLSQAFSKFPRSTASGEDIEEDFVYREKDLERCLDFYEEWKDHAEAKNYDFVEVKTSIEHLRIGMWYWSNNDLLLIVRLNWRDRMAKCLTYVPSNMTLFKDLPELEYFCDKETAVPFDDLLEEDLFEENKQLIPTSHWSYDDSAPGHEFTLYSNKVKRTPPRYFYCDKPKVLVLGAGSVGMSYGYEEEGWNVAWQVENDRNAADSLRRNYTEEAKKENRKLFDEPIDSFRSNAASKGDQYTFCDRKGKKEEVDHIHLSARFYDQNNAAISKDFIACIKLFKPKTGMYDSSTDLLLQENFGILQTMINDLKSLEYQMQLMVLDASDYGDPIQTKRVILWFAEETLYLPTRPRATHREERDEDVSTEDALDREKDELPEKVTAEEALSWLEDVEPCDSHRSIKVDGEQLHNHCLPQHTPSDSEWADSALDPNEPAPDFTRADHISHYDKKRLLTIRECMCLKSFDEQYEIYGSEEEQMAIIADAMPCRMARHLARAMALSYGLP